MIRRLPTHTLMDKPQPGSPHGRCAIKPRSAGDFYVGARKPMSYLRALPIVSLGASAQVQPSDCPFRPLPAAARAAAAFVGVLHPSGVSGSPVACCAPLAFAFAWRVAACVLASALRFAAPAPPQLRAALAVLPTRLSATARHRLWSLQGHPLCVLCGVSPRWVGDASRSGGRITVSPRVLCSTRSQPARSLRSLDAAR